MRKSSRVMQHGNPKIDFLFKKGQNWILTRVVIVCDQHNPKTAAQCRYLPTFCVFFFFDVTTAESLLFSFSSNYICCLQATNSMPANLIDTLIFY